MKKLDPEEYIANLSSQEKKHLKHALENEGIFVVQNAIKMKLFALYKIENITYIDYSTSIKEYTENEALLRKNIAYYNLLPKVGIYAKD